MSKIVPIRRSDLIKRLKTLGFEGPFTGGKPRRIVSQSYRNKLGRAFHGAGINL